MKYGVSSLNRTLVANNLVEEFSLWIMPTYVGAGKRAFEDVDTRVNLDRRYASIQERRYHPNVRS
jgi:dihydrofolate reductase